MINKVLSVLIVSCVMLLMLVNVVGINSNSYRPSQVNTSVNSDAVSLKDIGGPGPTKTPSPYTMPLPSSAMSDIQDVQTVGMGESILVTIHDNVLSEIKLKMLTTEATGNLSQ